MRTRNALALALVAAAALAAAGCFNPFAPRIAPAAGIYVPPPTPTSPSGVIKLLEWCWANRDITLYRQIFTDDFQFIFALRDSAGNAFRDPPLTREGELNMAQNLFVGGGNRAPASSITLHLDPTLNAIPDTRQGKDGNFHKEIWTTVNLYIKIESGEEYNIVGSARFYVVRGDSAMIPKDLGLGPDASRWYVERWNDESDQSGGSNAARPDPGLEAADAGAAEAARAARRAVPLVVTSVRPVRAGPAPSRALMPISFSDLIELYR